MSFRFALEGVLRYRRSLERRERMRLQELHARRTHLLNELENLRSMRLTLERGLRDALESEMVAGAELRFSATQAESVALSADRLRLQLEQLRKEILLQSERYRQERQQRDVLDALRERHLEEYQRTQQRREQAMLDELYLMRRNATRQPVPS